MALGVRKHMPAAQASALSVELLLQQADLAGDAQALERLALWAYRRYSPSVCVDPPDGLVLEVEGGAHRFGGEQGLIADLLARLQAFGVTGAAALADTWGAASALARFAARPGQGLVTHGFADLADLPVAALRLAPETVAALSRVGLETIGDLAGRPAAPLALRYGQDLIRRLDQAYGRLAEPIVAVVPPTAHMREARFPEPISAPETLSRHMTRLVEALCGDLEQHGLGVRRLRLSGLRLDSRVETVEIGLAQATRTPARLIRLLGEKIAQIDPGFGLEALRLSATRVEPLDWRPPGSDLTATGPQPPDGQGLAPLVDALENRLGSGRVYRVEPLVSDMPERCETRVAPLQPVGDLDWRAVWREDWPRPARLLHPPEPIETLAALPDYPPAAFTWRGVRRRVRAADGPERLYGEWWRRSAERDSVRDYFQLEDETGTRFWVFRLGDGERPQTGPQNWFLHGLFG